MNYYENIIDRYKKSGGFLCLPRCLSDENHIQFYRSENYKRYPKFCANYEIIDIFMKKITPRSWWTDDFTICHVKHNRTCAFYNNSSDYTKDEFKGFFIILPTNDNNIEEYDLKNITNECVDITFMFDDLRSNQYRIFFKFMRKEDAIEFFQYNFKVNSTEWYNDPVVHEKIQNYIRSFV